MKRKEKKYKEVRDAKEEEESGEYRKMMAAASTDRLDATDCKT
jgi:hypothetical protein